MFDISFAELMLIAVVALLVIGPDRLPKVARTLGAYTGRLQRYISQVKDEVNREINFEELQEMQQEIQSGVEEAKASIRDGLDKARQATADAEHSITAAANELSDETTSPKKTPTKKRVAKKPASKKKTPTKTAAAEKKPSRKKVAPKKIDKSAESAQ